MYEWLTRIVEVSFWNLVLLGVVGLIGGVLLSKV